MLPSSVADVARRFGVLQDEVVVEALALVASAIRRGRSSPEAWRDAVQAVAARLLRLQVLAASYADAYLNDVLAAQGADAGAEARVYPQAFADMSDGGSLLQSLVFAPNSLREAGRPFPETRFAFVANSIVKTGIGDTARAAVQSGMQARPAARGYVRMLRGKTCGRCVVLAGRVYRSSEAFNRHKRCDCVHVPADDNARGWATSPKSYFRSLTAAEQDETFGPGPAQAIREGADINQVVNAYRGVSTVTAYGRELRITTSGTTRRALFGAYEVLADGTLRRRRPTEAPPPRLLPDQIFQLSEEFNWDRAETLRQLRRYAYLL